LLVFQFIILAASLVLTIPARFARFAELQPMRSLQLVYILMFVFAGGLLPQFVLKNHYWRWLALFLPLCGGMYMAQRQLLPATPHLEWPGVRPRNHWVDAFVWVRQNTLVDAYFVLDPAYMEAAGEDFHGFRAIAERSRLADRVKDSGVVSMFPAMGQTWQEQVRSLDGWKNFQHADFLALRQRFGVGWAILQKPAGLPCPYENGTVKVCRIE
jgi:hypothetical protein